MVNEGSTSPVPVPPRRSAKIRPLLILAVLTGVYLWEPISTFGVYAPTDYLQGSELLRVAPAAYVRKNPLMGDVVDQMHPSLMWNRRQLWQGRLPTWNPYNGWGAPHLANYQSAVFSLFSVPFYSLPYRIALIVAAAMKLYGLGVFTFLFLRACRLHEPGALAGATVFMFGGYNVLWLSWAHVPTAVTLPIGMYCLERAFQCPAQERAQRRMWMLALAAGLAAGLLAGHPETFFYSAILLGAYLLVRSTTLSEPFEERLWRAAEICLAGLAALGVAAIQLFPFAEYLRWSTVFEAREKAGELLTLKPSFAALQAFPDLLGNPARSYYDPVLANQWNYNEANGHYVGLVAVFLAGIAVIRVSRDRLRLTAFFGLVCVAWVAYAYDILGAATLISKLPIFNVGVVTRSQVIWLFSMSCLVGLGVEALSSRGAARRTVIGGLVWALVLAVLAGVGAQHLLQWAASEPGNTVRTAEAGEFVWRHVALIVLTAAAALVCVGAMLLAVRREMPRLLMRTQLCLITLIFVQTGLLMRPNNPTIEAKYFYPATASLVEITNRTGAAQTLRLDGALMPANSNLWYELRSPSNYDAIGVAHYDWLHATLLRSPAYLETADPVSLRALQILGVQYVITTRAMPFATPAGAAVGTSTIDGLEHLWSGGNISLFAVPRALPQYFSVGHAEVAVSDEQAAVRLNESSFDPASTIVIHDAPQPPSGTDARGTVDVVDETPTRIRVTVKRDSPGWFVALQTFYPGWMARVDGRPAPIVRANVAFSAVAVGGGTSDVELSYEPRSVTLGLWISLLSGVGLVGGAVACLRARPTQSSLRPAVWVGHRP